MSSVILEINTVPKFAFLALPPPPKKKCAVVNNTFRVPASPVNRSNTILAWAETVHPGSPAPMTPASGTSLPRSASLTPSPLLQAFCRPSPTRVGSRRQPICSPSTRIPPTSPFHFTDTPHTPANPTPATPFSADAKFDFTAFGYASIFVDVPASTPTTPDIYKPKPMTRLPSPHEAVTAPIPTTPHTKPNGTGMLKRLLGNKPKAKSQTRPKGATGKMDTVVSDCAPVSLKKRSASVEKSPVSVEKQKREVYLGVLPPTVKQEAQMRQAVEGGSLECNIRKVMEEKAMQEGNATNIKTIEGRRVVEGVETAHRDERGGIWWDQEEQWEFAHLLASNKVPLSARCSSAEGWVTFNHLKEFEKDDLSELSSLPSSKYTDLYHSRPLVVTDEAAEQLVRGRAKRRSSVAGSIILPSPSAKPSNILLAIPSRPNRGRHLRPGFLKDVIAVPPTPSTPSAFSQASSRPPRSPARATRFVVNTSVASGRQRSRSRSLPRRQRKPIPPPLKIIPICPVNKLAVNVDPEEEDRRIFLDDSFKPGPITMAPRRSRETAALRPLLGCSGGLGHQMNGLAFVDIPKKSRRLGGFFRKGEKKW